MAKFKPAFPGDTPFAASIRAGIEATGGTHGRNAHPRVRPTPWTYRHDPERGWYVRDAEATWVCVMRLPGPQGEQDAKQICDAVNAGAKQ